MRHRRSLTSQQDPMKFAPKGHPQIKRRKVGVLIINLGTPDATDYFSMRRYLKEFLSDSRVIEAPRLLWWFILNFIQIFIYIIVPTVRCQIF